jgi:hypothetical protein
VYPIHQTSQATQVLIRGRFFKSRTAIRVAEARKASVSKRLRGVSGRRSTALAAEIFSVEPACPHAVNAR